MLFCYDWCHRSVQDCFLLTQAVKITSKKKTVCMHARVHFNKQQTRSKIILIRLFHLILIIYDEKSLSITPQRALYHVNLKLTLFILFLTRASLSALEYIGIHIISG